MRRGLLLRSPKYPTKTTTETCMMSLLDKISPDCELLNPNLRSSVLTTPVVYAYPIIQNSTTQLTMPVNIGTVHRHLRRPDSAVPSCPSAVSSPLCFISCVWNHRPTSLNEHHMIDPYSRTKLLYRWARHAVRRAVSMAGPTAGRSLRRYESRLRSNANCCHVWLWPTLYIMASSALTLDSYTLARLSIMNVSNRQPTSLTIFNYVYPIGPEVLKQLTFPLHCAHRRLITHRRQSQK